MSRFGGAPVLPVHHEDEDEDGELFETSSSISSDSDEEAQFPDSEDAEAHQFVQQAASLSLQPVRRLNSDNLYDLSSMMAQLPVKKGLSKYYDGKSESFACMSEVRCLEDLRKKESPYKKIKSCKSYVVLDGNQKDCHIPGPNSTAIPKKPSVSSCANLMARNNSKSMLYRPPPIPVNKSEYQQTHH